ncbi:MAG: hypothetical protein N4J56_004274 [Chroococcidiopsis sp. SAG 2025]|uniref:hypothetical protein n=1 Tax=Chroococcidiopsis sp. SAG 2025 TaxID=171389 RepID=UPI00293742F2|nr:hypothetical protein [Chroococcidiopsis sp. SAG 2025]MDV2994620.1 hypothetical protein [Chroococcidiopsis sp. SAG 2025]
MFEKLINKSVSSHTNKGDRLFQQWSAKGAFALAAIAIAMPTGYLNAREVTRTTNKENVIAQVNNQTTPQERRNTTSEELADKFKAMVGKRVTVRGRFLEKIGNNTFTIADEEFLGVEPILIVNLSGNPLDLPSNDIEVQATGVVRSFSLAEIAKRYNVQFDRATYAQYENDPVIIARSVAPAPEPEEITGNPTLYYNRRLAVPGNVQRVYSPNAFVLENNLLVLNPYPKQAARQKVTQGEKVVATGVLDRLVIADIEREYGFDLEPGLQRQLEVDYADRPVMIVDNVYPSAVEQ